MQVKNYQGYAQTQFADAMVAGMPMGEYRRHPAVSSSSLKEILRSPAHFKYGKAKEETRAMVIGTAIHTAILEPEVFERDYYLTEARDRRSKDYKAAVQDADGDDGRVLTAAESTKVSGMMQAVRNDETIRKLLDRIEHAELSGFTGIAPGGDGLESGGRAEFKFRADAVTTDGIMLDLKKAQDVRTKPLQRVVFNYGYDFSAASYCEAYATITGERPRAYALIAVEEEPPHAPRVVILHDDWLERGRRKFKRALQTYVQCSESGVWPWPGYNPVLEVPRFVEYEDEAEEG